jgi:hypothetical protein
MSGISAKAGPNADVLSASHSFSLGDHVQVTLTGNAGIGAQANYSLSSQGSSFGAGVTEGVGGAVHVNISTNGFKADLSGKVHQDINKTTTSTDVSVTPK